MKNIEGLVDNLSEAVETLIQERDNLKQEVVRLTAYVAERDKECAQMKQEMDRLLESAAAETQRIEHDGSEIEAKLQSLNDRLIALVASSSGEPSAKQG